MSVTALRPSASIDPHGVAPEVVLSYHILGTLRRDYRVWLGWIKDHVREGFSVPRSKIPHMHPSRSSVPCMFCAAYCGELSTVSAAILMTLAERKLRDDEWNASEERQPRHVELAARGLDTDDTSLRKVFGPHWATVIALAYRVEYSDAHAVAEIITTYKLTEISVFTDSRVGADDGPDWTLPARWLVSVAMSKKPSNVPANRVAHRRAVARLSSLADSIALDGPPTPSAAEWIPVPVNDDTLPVASPQLRIVME